MVNIEKLIGDLIDGQKVAFIGSLDEEGYPNIKAMLAPRRRENLKIFYFTANTSSIKVEQFITNSKASIYFCNVDNFNGIMLRGKMEIIDDDEIKNLIWREGDNIYYSGGITDPDYSVLKFTAESGRYYSNFKSEIFKIK